MLEKTDQFLLNKIEKFCHRFQQLTGKTNIFLALLTCFMYLAFFVAIMIASKRPTSVFLWINLFMGSLYILFYPLRERDAFYRISKGFSNPHKIDFFCKLLRKFSLIFLFVNLFCLQWLVLGGTLFLCLFFYLDSCDPLPPCRGKIREMIDAFFARPIPVPVKESDKIA